MLPFLKDLFTNETAFVGYIRAGLGGLGAAQMAGALPDTFPKWIGALGIAAAFFLRAGEKNPGAGK